MANKIKQHIPNFCDGLIPEKVEFETLDNLLNVPFVKQFSLYKGFKGYSVFKTPKQNLLIANYDNGEVYVVGYLGREVNLPTTAVAHNPKG